MNKNTLQILIVSLSLIGNFFVTQTSINFQIIGFSIWMVSNLTGTIFFFKNKFKIISLQYSLFFVFSSMGVFNRIFI